MTLRLLILAACAALAACGPAITMWGNFPGESCTDRASVRMIEVNYANRVKYRAQSIPPEILPELVAIRDVADMPPETRPGRKICRGTAEFADGTTATVWSGWSERWEPNLVSGPHFGFCVEGRDEGCGEGF